MPTNIKIEVDAERFAKMVNALRGAAFMLEEVDNYRDPRPMAGEDSMKPWQKLSASCYRNLNSRKRGGMNCSSGASRNATRVRQPA
jgi:hypothetical protein